MALIRMFSQVRFWGWSENKREEEKDFAELSDRARRGLPLYGESDQPEWIQGVAYRNSAFSQLKFRTYRGLQYTLAFADLLHYRLVPYVC